MKPKPRFKGEILIWYRAYPLTNHKNSVDEIAFHTIEEYWIAKGSEDCLYWQGLYQHEYKQLVG